jgi:hypothetical protein
MPSIHPTTVPASSRSSLDGGGTAVCGGTIGMLGAFTEAVVLMIILLIEWVSAAGK